MRLKKYVDPRRMEGEELLHKDVSAERVIERPASIRAANLLEKPPQG